MITQSNSAHSQHVTRTISFRSTICTHSNRRIGRMTIDMRYWHARKCRYIPPGHLPTATLLQLRPGQTAVLCARHGNTARRVRGRPAHTLQCERHVSIFHEHAVDDQVLLNLRQLMVKSALLHRYKPYFHPGYQFVDALDTLIRTITVGRTVPLRLLPCAVISGPT